MDAGPSPTRHRQLKTALMQHLRRAYSSDWAKNLTIVTAITNVCLVLFGGIGTYFIYHQLDSMKHSNELTRQALTQAAEQFDLQREAATEAAVEERRRFAAALTQQEENAEAIRRQMAHDSEAFRTQNEAHIRSTLDLARQSNEMTQESNRLASQGAALSRWYFLENRRPIITATRGDLEIKKNQVHGWVRFRNAGKGSAEAIDVHGGITIQDDDFDPFSLSSAELYRGYKSLSLKPTDEGIFWVARYFEPEEMEAVFRGERFLYVFGYVHPWFDPFKLRQEHLYFNYRLHIHDGMAWPGQYVLGEWHFHNSLQYDKQGDELYDGYYPEDNWWTVDSPPDAPEWHLWRPP